MRSLMFNYKLHDSLWGMAMIYACEIYNVMLSKKHGKTRSEVFLGKPPDVSTLGPLAARCMLGLLTLLETNLSLSIS
jgi:hypothetical protein